MTKETIQNNRFKFWVSCLNFTCIIEVENGKIVFAPDIIKDFIGEPMEKLIVHYGIDKISLIK